MDAREYARLTACGAVATVAFGLAARELLELLNETPDSPGSRLAKLLHTSDAAGTATHYAIGSAVLPVAVKTISDKTAVRPAAAGAAMGAALWAGEAMMMTPQKVHRGRVLAAGLGAHLLWGVLLGKLIR